MVLAAAVYSGFIALQCPHPEIQIGQKFTEWINYKLIELWDTTQKIGRADEGKIQKHAEVRAPYKLTKLRTGIKYFTLTFYETWIKCFGVIALQLCLLAESIRIKGVVVYQSTKLWQATLVQVLTQ